MHEENEIDESIMIDESEVKQVMAVNAAIMAELIESLDAEGRAKAMRIIAKHTKAKTRVTAEISDLWFGALTDVTATEEKKASSRKNIIRKIFLRNGFTVKEGQEDLKDYVYKAANQLIDDVERHFRKVGAILVFLSRRPTQQEIEHYHAVDNRLGWSTVRWGEHVGAREDDQHRVIFGSWYAVNQMLELRDKEIERQAFEAARKEGLV